MVANPTFMLVKLSSHSLVTRLALWRVDPSPRHWLPPPWNPEKPRVPPSGASHQARYSETGEAHRSPVIIHYRSRRAANARSSGWRKIPSFGVKTLRREIAKVLTPLMLT